MVQWSGRVTPKVAFHGCRDVQCQESICTFNMVKSVKVSFLIVTNILVFTAPFNNMQTIRFKAQPTNVFFATVDQVFSGSSQLPTTAEWQ